MSFCPSNLESFPFIFDPETFEKKMSMLPSNHDDLFSTIHQNFSKILTDTNLDAYANTSDFGVAEFSKIPQKSFMPLLDDQQTALDFDGLPGGAFKNNSRTPRAFGTGFGFSSLGFNQNDINPAAALMNNAAKGSLSRQLGFAGMPQMDYTSGRGMTEMCPQFDTMDNLTMKDFPSMHDYETLADDPLSLAWNNNGGSFKDTKNIRKQSGYMYGDNILNMDGGYNMPVGTMNESTGPSYTKTEPTSSGQSAQSQSNIVKKGEPINKKKSGKMESVSEIQPKKTDANPKAKEISPTQGKYNKFSDDEDDRDDFDADGKGRSSKGLRVLSLKVKDIVIEKKRTTYKEVATALIKELGGQTKTKSQGETKDEQNVKRRVYDALNVLIATGVLQKEGKTVTCAETASSLPVYSRKEIRDKKDLIEDKIAEAKRLKKQKLESLHEFLYKTLALKNLIKRNKDKAETEMLARKLNKNFVSNDTEGSIKFPFLVIQSSTGESSMNVNMDASQKELLVESKHELNVSGDIDVLIKMGLHHVSGDFFEKNIPQGLQKHVPKAFLNKLQ